MNQLGALWPVFELCGAFWASLSMERPFSTPRGAHVGFNRNGLNNVLKPIVDAHHHDGGVARSAPARSCCG
jgi:hypothetical protein